MAQKATNVVVRPETKADIAALKQITIAAFTGKSYSDNTEHLVLEGLRDSGALEISLVAEIDGTVVGHVAFYCWADFSFSCTSKTWNWNKTYECWFANPPREKSTRVLR